MGAQQLHRVDADRKARRPVVGEHPFPDGRLGKLGCRRRRVEWKSELLLLTARTRHALRARDETELPEQLTPRQPEAVCGAGDDQRLECMARELRALGEVADAPERTAGFPFRDDRTCLVLATSVII